MTVRSSALPSSSTFSMRARSVWGATASGRGFDVVRGMVVTSLASLPMLPRRMALTALGADLRGRARIEPDRQEHPGGWGALGKASCRLGRHPPACTTPCRQPGQTLKTIGRPRQDCNGNTVEDLRPAVPVADLRQIVGAHQPDEARARE